MCSQVREASLLPACGTPRHLQARKVETPSASAASVASAEEAGGLLDF